MKNVLTLILMIAILLIFTDSADARKPKLILDADTANEIDDMYAIVRMLRQDRFDVLALNSTQWTHYLATGCTVSQSQQENESLKKLLGKNDLPTPVGSKEPMGKPWGGTDAKNSDAAQFIIRAAREATPDDKLIVVCLGATTNLASAIKLSPDVASNIRAYALGFKYDWATNTWNKSSFNVRRDLNAADFVLDCRDLELHIMPANVAKPLTFDRETTFERHDQMGALGAYLTKKWQARFGEFGTWVMWDLALVQAVLMPKTAEELKVFTPPENVRRKVWVYKKIDVSEMRSDYWKVALPEPAN